jgi:hypothetical protein
MAPSVKDLWFVDIGSLLNSLILMAFCTGLVVYSTGLVAYSTGLVAFLRDTASQPLVKTRSPPSAYVFLQY